jgi:hypothetical protein
MGRFTVRCYDDGGVPVNPDGDDPLPTVEAETPLEAAQAIRGLPLSQDERPAAYKRAEVWPYGKPNEKMFFYERNN